MLRSRTSCVLLLHLTLVASALCDTPPALTAEQTEAHLASFDKVWETVRDRHWDTKLNGVDWDAAREELRPKVAAATSDQAARAAIQEMLGRLGQSHFGIIAKDTYEKYETAQRSGDDKKVDGWLGLEVRARDGAMLITQVHADSPAAKAGIRAGWTIDAIDDLKATAAQELAEEMAGLERAETIVGLLALRRLQGAVGETISIAIRDTDGKEQTFELTCATSPGKLATLGSLPPTPVVIETRTLEGGAGYFRLNVFFDPPRVLSAYRNFLKEHAEADGVVLDLRGNLGGIILMSSGMMNYLIDEKGLKLGTMKMRDAARGAFELPIMLNPRGSNYRGKVAVLIDELSISNAEILAAGLKDIGRARLFGTQTAGLVLPSTVERLPNGDGFQYAFASYTSSQGDTLEGIGVKPDAAVTATATGLLQGIDAPLAAALAWIQETE